jgi:hypothetical protein
VLSTVLPIYLQNLAATTSNHQPPPEIQRGIPAVFDFFAVGVIFFLPT